MTVTVNGERRELSEDTTVAALVAAEDLARPGVAVAVNRQVVRRAEWSETNIKDGDAVEIIHAVQGG